MHKNEEWNSKKILKIHYDVTCKIQIQNFVIYECMKQFIITFDSPSLLAITPRILETGISSYEEGPPLGTCTLTSLASCLAFATLGAPSV